MKKIHEIAIAPERRFNELNVEAHRYKDGVLVEMTKDEWIAVLALCGIRGTDHNLMHGEDIPFDRASYRMRRILEGSETLRIQLELLNKEAAKVKPTELEPT